MVRAAPARIIMTTPRPPWQLTTSELAREIEALEASPRELPSAGGEHGEGRLAQLYAERDERKRLADHNARVPARQFPDDASLTGHPAGHLGARPAGCPLRRYNPAPLGTRYGAP